MMARKRKETIASANDICLLLTYLLLCRGVLRPLTKTMNWDVPYSSVLRLGTKFHPLVFSNSNNLAKKMII